MNPSTSSYRVPLGQWQDDKVSRDDVRDEILIQGIQGEASTGISLLGDSPVIDEWLMGWVHHLCGPQMSDEDDADASASRKCRQLR